MKTPEEIKKALKLCGGGCRGCSFECPYNSLECVDEMSRDALAYIQQLENQLRETTKKIAQLEAAQPKWISVEDRLPEDDELYLVIVSDRNGIEISRYYGDGEWLTNDFENLTRYVTHWMPLPDPQKEE